MNFTSISDISLSADAHALQWQQDILWQLNEPQSGPELKVLGKHEKAATLESQQSFKLLARAGLPEVLHYGDELAVNSITYCKLR